jgi:hypothetical protein
MKCYSHKYVLSIKIGSSPKELVMIEGFKGSRIQGVKDSRGQGFKDSRELNLTL